MAPRSSSTRGISRAHHHGNTADDSAVSAAGLGFRLFSPRSASFSEASNGCDRLFFFSLLSGCSGGSDDDGTADGDGVKQDEADSSDGTGDNAMVSTVASAW